MIRKGKGAVECQVRGIRVHYETFGEGRPMIMLHGFGPDHRLMTGCMEPIFRSREGWKRIYLDLPGMGKTKAEDWLVNSDQMLDIILGFITALIPGRHIVVVGESYGGYLARGVIHRLPALVDGLLLICPMTIADSKRRTLPHHVTLARDAEAMSELTLAERQDFESYAVVQTQETWKRVSDEVNVGFAAADEAFLSRLQSDGYAFSFDVNAASAFFDGPALILVGRQDAIVGYRDTWQILEKYPRATFAVLDRAGHDLQIEQEGLFNALVSEWLDRVEESSAGAIP